MEVGSRQDDPARESDHMGRARFLGRTAAAVGAVGASAGAVATFSGRDRQVLEQFAETVDARTVG